MFRCVERFIGLWKRDNCGTRVVLAFVFHLNIMLLRVLGDCEQGYKTNLGILGLFCVRS